MDRANRAGDIARGGRGGAPSEVVPLTDGERGVYHDALHIGLTASEMIDDFVLMLLYLTGERGDVPGRPATEESHMLRARKAYPEEVLARFARRGLVVTSDHMKTACLTHEGELEAATCISVYKFLQDCIISGAAEKVTGAGFIDDDPHELDWMKP